jgi:hypothetical protein
MYLSSNNNVNNLLNNNTENSNLLGAILTA